MSSTLFTSANASSSSSSNPQVSLMRAKDKPCIHHGLFESCFGARRFSLLSLQAQASKPQSTAEKAVRLHKEIQMAIQKAPVGKGAVFTPVVEERDFSGQLAVITSLGVKANPSYMQKPSKLIIFCELLTKGTQSPQNTRKILGEIIYLAEHDFQETEKLVAGKDTQRVCAALSARFQAALQAHNDRLVKKKAELQANGIQDMQVWISIKKPIEIAKVLITSTGFFNRAIIEQVKKAFLVSGVHAEYERDIACGLDSLKNAQELQQKIEAITKPAAGYYDSNIVIRATLGLAPNEVVTDAHAKMTAISAELSNMRQGPVGNCFAAFLAYELLEMRPDKCLDDFTALLKNDELIRIVEGSPKEFEYVLDISDDDIRKEFTLTPNWKIKGTQVSIWMVPGIRASCKMMGIKEGQEVGLIKLVIADIKKAKNEENPTLTAHKLIYEIASRLKSGPLDVLFTLGKFAFSAETNNPLLRVWESSIAGMAEARTTDLVRSKILTCVSQALKLPLKPVTFSDSLLEQQIQATFQQVLGAKLTLRFDPSISLGGLSADGRSTDGAFVSYEGGKTSSSETRIDTPDKFVTFVEHTIPLTQKALTVNLANDQDREKLVAIMQRVSTFLRDEKEAFLNLALLNYDTENRRVKNPLPNLLQNWEKLEHTPWIDRTGDDNREVLDTYLERPIQTKPVSYTPKNAQDLLRFVLKFARDEQASSHFLDDEYPRTLYPCDTPTHAFSLIPEHPTVTKAVRSDKSIDLWISENVVNPALQISQGAITEQVRTLIIDYISTKILAPEYVDSFKKLMATLNGELSLRAFRSKALEALRKVSHIRPSMLSQRANMLDSYILQLCAELKKTDLHMKAWVGSIVHFADSNWNDGVKDIHFCLFLNPTTEIMQFGSICDDGTGLTLLPQNDWVTNQQWNFYRLGVG